MLGCAVADELYARFPQLREGKLTQLRASLVREEALAEVGERLRLTEFLRLELQPNARTTASILADTVEALFGAIFLDGGYVAARMSVVRVFAPLFARLDAHMPKDAKTRLQEIMQARKQKLPEYRVVGEHGQAHARTFDVECVVGPGLSAKGSGSSRQRAEQQAATAMLEQLSK